MTQECRAAADRRIGRTGRNKRLVRSDGGREVKPSDTGTGVFRAVFAMSQLPVGLLRKRGNLPVKGLWTFFACSSRKNINFAFVIVRESGTDARNYPGKCPWQLEVGGCDV